jgi:hypothetical protein
MQANNQSKQSNIERLAGFILFWLKLPFYVAAFGIVLYGVTILGPPIGVFVLIAVPIDILAFQVGYYVSKEPRIGWIAAGVTLAAQLGIAAALLTIH